MSRMTIIAISIVITAILVGGAAVKWGPSSSTKPAIGMVDLAGIVERQRLDVLRRGKDPDLSAQMMQQRMIRLASVLVELGQKQLILNKAAVITGTIPDLTKQIEERLSDEEGK